MISKLCPRCKLEKPTIEFHKRSDRKSGVQSLCKPCRSEIDSKPEYKTRRRLHAARPAAREAGRLYRETSEGRAAGEAYEYSPERQYLLRRNNLKRYGLTPEEFDSMLLEQGGSCKICKSSVPGNRTNRFFVDHCHTTKRVRGLLCMKCNTMIGMASDNPNTLISAAEYLRLS